ncbi:DUF333 domain-containing protein [Rhabdochromatium marinum]|uniref:putative hemolysin n=1 Tax=Rhabdochromatium marinum TaxID=48729 RepID=UPI0019064927|nr:DUF333 domain-containing protein [Rhabdochromatium marinum]MBK1649728.1 hypothetical protein [Rhabdochromatium marinum]
MRPLTTFSLLIASLLAFFIAPALVAESLQAGLANPASMHCYNQGGTLDIRKRTDSGEYGVCLFEDNRQCEEWALLRGHCPTGGLKITGYDNQAQIYCAITGGDVDIKANRCQTNDGVDCNLDAYFSGRCP